MLVRVGVGVGVGVVIVIWILWRKFDSRPFPPLLLPSELRDVSRKPESSEKIPLAQGNS